MDGPIASHSGPRRLTSSAAVNAPAHLSVDLYLMPAGTVEAAPSTSHVISMHAGTPVQAWCLCDGLSQRRLQAPGDIDIVPAGASGVWTDEQSATILLLQGRLSASQIALETGFSHQSHMARCMRRLLGVGPSALVRASR